MLAWLERNQVLVLGLAALVFAAGLAASALTSDPSPLLEVRDDSMLPDGAPIRVHVAGAVAAPGVYELQEGDRLAEALAAAGGPAADADLDAINLARRVHDEEQVLVPRHAGVSSPVRPLAPGEQLDLNAASAAELDLLPGIGEAYSRRIVHSRLVDGPYTAVEDLVERPVIPRATFERIRDMVTVGP